MGTPDTALAGALATESGRPLITHYDDRTGERVELSVATVENWVAKTANLLQDAGVEPGATAAVLLPAHWQTAVVLLGCWRAGVQVTTGATDVAFTTPDRAAEAVESAADEVWALSLAPLAAPLRTVPAGTADYSVEVRGQGDRFVPYGPVDPDAAALDTFSLADLLVEGRRRADAAGLTTGGRLLVGTDAEREPSPLDWLLAPLAVDGSLVLLRYPNPGSAERIAAAERVTARL